ncbi:MAG TPA: phosphate ABC transporter permease PstA [Hyphomicrobiales bacterium]|nr:phosphate ABC transporter permease PstA [Kaistiaceae bacterium]HQF29895.1 phosphate ABC transporter permease PstA [Hyphomicrobiales bacterium]
MTDAAMETAKPVATRPARTDFGLKKRYRVERRFRIYGVVAIALGLFFLVALISSIVLQGISAFRQANVEIDVLLDKAIIAPNGAVNTDALMTGNVFRYDDVIRNAFAAQLGIAKDDKGTARTAYNLVSKGARIQLRAMLAANPDLVGTRQKVSFLLDSNVDAFLKGHIDADIPESRRPIKDRDIAWIKQLEDSGALSMKFNTGLFTFGASSRPETAGVGVAVIGSLYMMAIVLALALPIGVAASIYLEEFAPQNRLTDLIEVNINNLAAVPSIVFGILGLAVFINFAGLPRSASLVGGLVLTLMTLPTIIIATRAALKGVPPSIREAALGVGASKMQAIFHHVLPLATPGILTGTIIGLAQALGETAPLLMIGMVAFVADYPVTPNDPATALPVQIYMWAGQAERAFVERTSAAIIILLAFLAIMNITAVFLRKRFERRW